MAGGIRLGLIALLLLLLPLLLWQTVAAQGPATVAGSMSVKKGEEFYVTLESNRTTGYQWQFAGPLDEKLVKLLRTEYVVGAPQMPGAGGVEVWIFRAEDAGQTQISMEYVRPWEKGKTPARAALFAVTINP